MISIPRNETKKMGGGYLGNRIELEFGILDDRNRGKNRGVFVFFM